MISIKELGIPKQSIIYILFCLAGVFLFLAAGTYPQYLKWKDLDAEVALLRSQLKIQQVLQPVYLRLRSDKILKENQQYMVPESSSLPQDAIPTIPFLFGKMARDSNMDFVSAYPLLKSMNEDRSMMMISVNCHGKWDDFRRFLVSLAESAFVSHIEEIEVMTSENGIREYIVHVWVLIQ